MLIGFPVFAYRPPQPLDSTCDAVRRVRASRCRLIRVISSRGLRIWLKSPDMRKWSVVRWKHNTNWFYPETEPKLRFCENCAGWFVVFLSRLLLMLILKLRRISKKDLKKRRSFIFLVLFVMFRVNS